MCVKYNFEISKLSIYNDKFISVCDVRITTVLHKYFVYVERQQERGVLKHVRKTRNHQLIFRLISRYF